MQKLSGLRVCHVASGDLWAGAEVQLASLLCEFKKDPFLDVRAILLNKGVLYDRLTDYGIPTQVLDERVLSSVEIAKRLYWFNKDWKPHVVHTHRYKENFLGGLAASCARVPVIVNTVHGIHEALAGWENIKWRLYTLIARQITRWVASGLIGVSVEIASILKKRFPGLEVICIHNGIQYDAMAEVSGAEVTRESVGITDQAFVVGTVGRLTPIKGIEYLLQGVSLLVHEQTVPLIQVVIVGIGPLRTELERLAQRLGISERVRFMGERQDVPSLLGLFDIFVMPSLHEGIPMALLEALAAGCPVVASAVGGVPEVVRDGKDGMLVPSKDPAAIAEAIQALHASQPLRARFQQAGPERVVTEFGAERMASCTKDFYVNLVKRPK
jgi:L-malate glycosyltransferase